AERGHRVRRDQRRRGRDRIGDLPDRHVTRAAAPLPTPALAPLPTPALAPLPTPALAPLPTPALAPLPAPASARPHRPAGFRGRAFGLQRAPNRGSLLHAREVARELARQLDPRDAAQGERPRQVRVG